MQGSSGMDGGGRQLNHEVGGSTFGRVMEPAEVNANRFAQLVGGQMSLDATDWSHPQIA
jgi:hypothetical protein